MISKLIAYVPAIVMAMSATIAMAHPIAIQDAIAGQCQSSSDCNSQTECNLQKEVPAEFAQALEKLGLWRESLNTLRVVYTWTDPQSYRFRHIPGRAGKLPVYRTEMKWQDWWVNTNSQLLKADTRITNSMSPTVRLVTGRTNHYQYYAEYTNPYGSPRLLTAADLGAKKTLQNTEQMPLYPIYFAITGWFSSAFERLPAEYYGTRIINGSRCIGISLEGTARPVMWLDVEHDGLPRLIEPAGNVTRWEWICDEFQRTEDGKWFPAKGRFGFVGEEHATFHVELVEINSELPSDDFQVPVVSKGTYVRDMTASGIRLNVVDDVQDYSHASTASWWKSPLVLTMILGGAGTLLLRISRAAGMIPCPVPVRSRQRRTESLRVSRG